MNTPQNRRVINCPLCGGVILVQKAQDLYSEQFPTKGERETESSVKTDNDFVTFGTYQQTPDKAPLEWEVLDVQADKALLMSKYALSYRSFAEKQLIGYQHNTWASSDLRVWLNSVFLKRAFLEEERALIVNTSVTTEPNPTYKTDPGPAVDSKIFLLSIQEVNKYLKTAKSRKCLPTAAAKKELSLSCVFHPDTFRMAKGCSMWWLRSPGTDRNHTACISYTGSVNLNGHFPHSKDYAVRPVLWIKL